MRFVTFHVRLPDHSKAIVSQSSKLIDKAFVVRHLFSSDRQSTSQDQMIFMCLRSARYWHPDCSLVVLTDLSTSFGSLPEGAALVRTELDATRIMYSRLLAQIAYLRSLESDETVVLLDSDMLVNGSLVEFDRADFALGLTIRDNSQMPVNGGLLIVSGSRRAEAIELLSRVAEIYQDRYRDQAVWWGDQLALRDLVLERFGENFGWTPVNQSGLWLVDSAAYNYTPDYSDMYVQLSWPRKFEKVLHFKGGRKRLMRQYWLAFVDREPSALERLKTRALLKALAAIQVVRRWVSIVCGRGSSPATVLE